MCAPLEVVSLFVFCRTAEWNYCPKTLLLPLSVLLTHRSPTSLKRPIVRTVRLLQNKLFEYDFCGLFKIFILIPTVSWWIVIILLRYPCTPQVFLLRLPAFQNTESWHHCGACRQAFFSPGATLVCRTCSPYAALALRSASLFGPFL